jgi:hypothetical protein
MLLAELLGFTFGGDDQGFFCFGCSTTTRERIVFLELFLQISVFERCSPDKTFGIGGIFDMVLSLLPSPLSLHE